MESYLVHVPNYLVISCTNLACLHRESKRPILDQAAKKMSPHLQLDRVDLSSVYNMRPK